jgi:hypothetical protein
MICLGRLWDHGGLQDGPVRFSCCVPNASLTGRLTPRSTAMLIAIVTLKDT